MKREEVIILDKLLKDYKENIRAEVFMSELEDNGFKTDGIDIECCGSFLRPFRNDIMGKKSIEYHPNDYAYTLLLSRNGIYDVLPEGIIHKHEVSQGDQKSVNSYTDTYKKRKQEEAEARNFFKPFENEFFNTRKKLEKTEKDLLCLKQKHFFNFLASFWRIDADLPANLQEQLLHILPYAHEIAGDFELISRIIAISLKTNASYKINYKSIQAKNTFNKLGKQQLGENSIIGYKTAPNPVVIFQIGEVPPEKIGDYINEGKYARFLKVLFEYLIPLEFDVETKWKTSTPKRTHLNNKKTAMGYLGYTV